MAPLTHRLRAKSQRRRAALARSQATERNVPPRNDLLPKLMLVERAVGELQPPARNARPVDPEHAREIAAAIGALGFSVPVLIDPENRVIDGWARVQAARQAGLGRLPCILADHLTPAERRLLRIAVNRLGETGQWDLGALKLELES